MRLDQSDLIGSEDGLAVLLVSEPGGVAHSRAQLPRRARLWMVADLDTADGTFVNERRIEGPAAIRPGDVIRVSETRLRVVAFEESPAVPRVVGRACYTAFTGRQR